MTWIFRRRLSLALSGQGGLSELNDAWKAGLDFRKTFVDHGQQRDRRERLAQTARRAELEGHPQEIRRRRIEVREGVAGHRNQRNRRRALVEYPDRFEAAHVRHEDVDDHQVEERAFQRPKPEALAMLARIIEIYRAKA